MIIDIFKQYSQVLFLNHKIAGFLIFCITFINYSVAISGILAIVFTLIFAKFLDIKNEHLREGFYIYNSLLVGMGIGFIFMLTITSILLIAVASAFTFMLSFMLNRLFSVYQIPILSLPFSIMTIFIYLASLRYSALFSSLINNASIYDIQLPIIISGFLKSFGTIFFLPNNISGILLFIITFYFSRIVAILAVCGFYFGIFFHSFLIGSIEQALGDVYAFNYILTAIALGSIFLIPSIKNFFLSFIGVAISVVLTDSISVLFNYYSIPVFTMPFNLTVIIFIFILSAIKYPEFNYNIKATPEQSLSNYLGTIFRFGTINIKISLPFSGIWKVYQGFNGEWTHKGKYNYACDFVKTKNDITYKNDGIYCSDYYSFGESILAPVNGYIIDTKDDLIDNNIGDVDKINNWGNYIIIKSDLGFFVKICHIMQCSISCKIGEYINVNQIIAKCGNSGYSPEPHIHIQTQYLGVLGGFTQEFCFKECYEKNNLIFNYIPKKNSYVGSVIADKGIASKFGFILDDVFVYEVYDNGKIKTILWKTKMNEFGEFFIEDENKNKLYFSSDGIEFYFYNYTGRRNSYLERLFIVVPRFPYINKDDISFYDYLPINLLYNRFKVVYLQLLSVFNKNYSKIRVDYLYSKNSVTSKYGVARLSSHSKGFQVIKYKNITLKRVEYLSNFN
jgi:urea transporter/murein DD-endopeptidase MepM/ murein hydrolase activator NlpD